MVILYSANKKLRAIAIWCACIRVGAWPTPAISASCGFGPRRVISSAVARDSRSDSSPRISSVGQRIASKAAHSAAWSCSARSGVIAAKGWPGPGRSGAPSRRRAPAPARRWPACAIRRRCAGRRSSTRRARSARRPRSSGSAGPGRCSRRCAPARPGSSTGPMSFSTRRRIGLSSKRGQDHADQAAHRGADPVHGFVSLLAVTRAIRVTMSATYCGTMYSAGSRRRRSGRGRPRPGRPRGSGRSGWRQRIEIVGHAGHAVHAHQHARIGGSPHSL
jgi:hypothetical protein